MKEVLTKSFWRDVKKTFYAALEGPPSEKNVSEATGDTRPEDLSKPESPPLPPPAASKQS